MKASNVLATVLFGSIAAAAPFDKRALVTKTSVIVETVVVYTTVYADDIPIAPATTTPGLFFEKPKSSNVVPTSTAVYNPPVVEVPSSSAPAPVSSAPAPSSTYVAPAPVSSVEAVQVSSVEAVQVSSAVVEAPAPTSIYTPVAEPTSVYTPVAEPTSIYTPAPASSSVYVAPAPVSSAVVVPSSTPSTPTGDKYSGDITIYDNTGGFGACGTALYDTDMVVALSVETWGASTYDVMTGAATNPWCNQKITIEYKGNTVEATIMDMCPGCKGKDIDLSLAVWKKLTGLDEKTRLQADWWKSG
jgi:hypothetical protein